MVDFTINTTADFDAGVKSNSSGNLEIETVTDNSSNSANLIVLANRSGDNFNFADADALTWKWQDGGSDFITDRNINTTTNNTLYMKQTMVALAGAQILRTTDTLSGNFDVRMNFKTTFENGNQHHGFRFYIDASNSFVIYIRKSAAGAYTLNSTITIAGVGTTQTTTSWTDYDLSFRLVRSGTNVYTYYDLAGGDSWTQHYTLGSFSSSAGYLETYVYHGVTAGITYCYNTNLRCDTATWSTAKYRTSGNWISALQTIPTGNVLSQLSIITSQADANNYVDKIEIYNSSNVLITTYNGNITTATTTNLTSVDFDNGLSGTEGINIKIKIYAVGNGTSSPIITSVVGTYVPASGNVFFYDTRGTQVVFL